MDGISGRVPLWSGEDEVKRCGPSWRWVDLPGASSWGRGFQGGFFVQFWDQPTEPCSSGGIWEAPKLSGPISPDLTFLGSFMFQNQRWTLCMYFLFASCVMQTSAWPTCVVFVHFCFVIVFRSSLQLGWAVPWSFGVGLAARAASSGRSPKHLGEKIRRKNRWDTKGFSTRFPWALERERGEGWGAKGWWSGQGCGFTRIHMDSYGFYVGPVIKFMHVYEDVMWCLQRARLVVYADAHVLFFGRNDTSTYLEIYWW